MPEIPANMPTQAWAWHPTRKLQRNTSDPTPRSVTAGLLLFLLLVACSRTATADDFSGQSATASNAGQTAYKLKWLPYRPSEPVVISTEATTKATSSRVVQTAASAPVRVAQRPSGSVFDNPFGDANAASEPFPLEMAPPGDLPSGTNPIDDLPGTITTRPNSGGFDPMPPSAIPPSTRPPSTIGPMTTERPLTAETLPGDSCPSPRDPIYYTNIGELMADITPTDGALPKECVLNGALQEPFAAGQVRGSETGRPWSGTTFMWKASALCHKPLYFEDPHLERYGHSWGPHLQPLVSGARFFLGVPSLPYQMGLYPPFECVYALGEYRPGSCAPKMLDPLPLSIRAALAQGGVWTGMVAAIP